MSEGKVAAARVAETAAEGGMLVRLIFFAASLAIVPLSTYFGTQKYLWDGNSTFAAISAVFAANVVLVAYIVQSVYEDKAAGRPSVSDANPGESRKER